MNRKPLFLKKHAWISFLFMFCFLCAYPQKAKKPSWIDYYKRASRYPTSIYLVGFSSEEHMANEEKTELMDRLKSYARVQLVQSVHVNIKSLATSQVVTQNTVTNEYFRQTSVSLSSINLSGLISEEYYDEKEQIGYALAYAKKADVSALYHNNIYSNKEKVKKLIKSGKEYELNGNVQNALKVYYQCFAVFRELEEAQVLVMAFENKDINSSDLFVDEIEKLKVEVNNHIKGLTNSENMSIDDICLFMANALKLQLTNLDEPIELNNISFQDSKIGSIFSKRFSDSFEQKLISSGFQVVKPDVFHKTGPGFTEAPYFINGTYWEEGDCIKVITIMRDKTKGNAIASSEAKISTLWLKNNKVEYKPNNFEDVRNNQDILLQDAIVSSGLTVNISTNNGYENPIFVEGQDTMKFYIKANRPCFIRLVYYLADGSKVLMLDNLYIDKTKVNKVYEIPEKFEVASPFGAEILQLNAQTEEFNPLHTTDYYGYQLIKDDIGQLLANTRGFKPVKEKSGKAEARINLTTVPKESSW